MSHSKALAFLLLGVSFNVSLRAQGVSANIRGTVTDSSGAVLAGAKLTVHDETKGGERIAISGASGEYEFVQLPPADKLTLTAEYGGFRKEARSGIVLETGQQSRVDLTLSPGEVTDSVSVQEESSLVQTEDASVGAVVDERKIKELPLNGRQFWQLAQLVPNVFPPTQNSSLGFRGGFNVAGHGEATNNYVLDGVDNADSATLQPTNRPSVDGIQEFKVLTGVYNAEYGRYSGGQILVTTKSGSNSFHGTAYEFLRNSALDARNFYSPHDVPAFRRNQFGASQGGRIRKNRTFYFATYEGLRLSSQTTGLGSVPTADLASGNLNGLGGTIKDPQTNAPFPNNIIPASRLSSVSQALLRFYPAPTRSGLVNNYTFSEVGPETDNQFSGRIDQVITSKNNLFVSYQFAQRTTFYPSNTACALRQIPGFGCTEPERDQGVSISDVHVFSPSVVNELRLGYNRIRTNRLIEDAALGNVDRQLGIPQNGNGTTGNQGLPQVTITGFATLGGSSGLPNGRRDNTYNIIDGLSWIRGAHSFKIGADYKRFIYNYMQSDLGSSRGAFTFNGLYTGNAFADFLLGDIRSTSQNPGDPTVRSYTPSTGFYAQDEWKATQRLTISYGLRYELFFPERERLNKIASFDPATGLVPVSTGQLLNANAAGQLVSAGASSIGNTAWKLQKNNLAPRFGLAFRPFADNKTVLRAGYGIFYNLLADGNGISQLFRGIPFRASQTFTNTASQLIATWANPYPTNVGFAVGGYTPNGVVYNFKTPYTQQWSAGVEREIARDLVLEVTYLGSKGTHLPLSTNINQPDPGAGPIQSRRPYPQWGNITWVDSVGISSYHSLAARLERRYTNGLSLLSSWTWSHSLDDGGGSGDGETGVQDPRNINANKGSSEFDIRQRFVVSAVYELPFGRGKALGSSLPGYLRTPLSGWETTAIFTAQSGSPFSVTTSTDISNTGGANRPFLVGDPAVSDPIPTRWFNTAAFSTALPAGTYSYGNVGRNTLRGDGTQNVDFGLFRNFSVRERLGVQFRGELFNILNHPNFGLPDRDASSATFGRVTQTSTSGRQIQFGVKLLF